MNHILKLQNDLRERDAAIREAQEQITNFFAHLRSDKFVGEDSDGARKDWISTTDVIQRLADLRTALGVCR